MEIMEDGQKKVRLWGSYAATYSNDDKNETRIKGPVTIHVFDSVGTVKTKVYSNRAVYKPEDTIFELFGDVQVETRDNRHLDSEYLEWNQSTNNISTPKFVIIKTPTDSIAGTGFEGGTDLVNYTIKEPKGRVIVD
jgi:LPS export ABC transporter protein LptC